MGNASSIDGDESSINSRFSTVSTSSSSLNNTNNPLLQRKVSSFLEEPICIKHTERGDAPLLVPPSSKFKLKKLRNADKVRFAVSEMQGWRSHMEDRHCINPPLSSSHNTDLMTDHYLFAVFDGHGGNFTSYYCGDNLVQTLTSQNQWKVYLNLPKNERGEVTGIKMLKEALSSTFLALDTQIQEAQRQKRLSQLDELQSILSQQSSQSIPEEYQTLFQTGSDDNMAVRTFVKPNPPSVPPNVNLERSGSTGVVVLVTPTHILCANAGDSRALLCRSGAALPLSFDHKPNNDCEAARIDTVGGFVRAGRVNGDLAVSRSFGDFSYKCKTFADARMQEVTVDPDIIVHTRDYEKDEYIVLACDGVWDRLTNRDAATLVRSCLDEGESDVGLVCEEIIDTALEMDSRDNMTAALIVFPGAKMADRSYDSENMGVDVVVPDEIVGVRKRRIERERKWGPNSTVAGRAQKRLEDRRKKSSKNLLDMQRLRAVQQQVQKQQQNKASLEIKSAASAYKISGTKHTVPAKGHASKVMKKNVRTTSTNSGLQVQ
jgi:serine/threonine protein phosphatase PrpC